jgi:hypothetical protein
LSSIFLLLYGLLPQQNQSEFIAWLVCISVSLPIVIVFSIHHFFDGYPQLISRRRDGVGNFVSIYEIYSPALTTGGDNRYCRYRIRQEQIFPGLFKNKGLIDSEDSQECQPISDRDRFPDYLK